MVKQNSKQNGSKTEAKRPPEVRSQKPEVITYGSEVIIHRSLSREVAG